MIRIDWEGDPDYMYGIEYHGRDIEIQWFRTKAEAIIDAQSTDGKYLPGELVRTRMAPAEYSGLAYGYQNKYSHLGWHRTPVNPKNPPA